MNRNDRKQLNTAIPLLHQVHELIDQLRNNECEKFDNLNEGLQESKTGQAIEESMGVLEDLCWKVQEIIDEIADIAEPQN